MHNASSLTRIPESVAQTSEGRSWNDPVNVQTSPSVLGTVPPVLNCHDSIVTYNGVKINKPPAHKSADSISYQPSTKPDSSIPLANADELHDTSLAATTEPPTVRAFRLETHLPNPANWTVSSPWSESTPRKLQDPIVRQLARDWCSLDNASFEYFEAAYQSTRAVYSVKKLAQLLSAAVLSTNPYYTKVCETRKKWSLHQQTAYGAQRVQKIFFGEGESVTADSPVYGYRHAGLPEECRTTRAEVNVPVELWMACIALDPSVAWFKVKGGEEVPQARASIRAALSAFMPTVNM